MRCTGDQNEDTVPGEGSRTFDIRFHGITPGNRTGHCVKLLFDVEAQKRIYLGYRLVTRGIFYTARMISAQLGTEFVGSNYDSIKKVYSIWICMGAPRKNGNTTTEYAVRKRDLHGKVKEDKNSYDKMTIIMISLNEESPAEKGSIHDMLNTLFSTKISIRQKKEKLSEIYGLELETDLEQEVRDMCNWSDVIEERGIERGMERGEECFALLTGCMLRDNKLELLQKAIADKELRNELYQQYGISKGN